MRYDRIMARLPANCGPRPGCAWQPMAIDLVGTDPCPVEPPEGVPCSSRCNAALTALQAASHLASHLSALIMVLIWRQAAGGRCFV